jgi:hypothetical protein
MADPAADDASDPAPQAAADDVIAGSLADRLKDLADDTRTAIEAELAWQGARASFVGGRAGGIAGWAALAVLCGFIALLSLAFGAILALVPHVGAVLATLIVVAALLLVAAVAGLVARSRVRRVRAVAFPAKPKAAP